MRVCTKCNSEKPLDHFHRDKSSSMGRRWHCKECANTRARTWNANNKERKLSTNRKWNAKNQDRVREYTMRWRSENYDHYRAMERARATKNSALVVSRVKKWREENPEIAAAGRRSEAARRRARIKRACPPWADLEKIDEIYLLADRLSRETGIPHDVDHIIPIAGRRVCGLHVHQNLRVIPASENRKKSSKEIEWADRERIPWAFNIGRK